MIILLIKGWIGSIWPPKKSMYTWNIWNVVHVCHLNSAVMCCLFPLFPNSCKHSVSAMKLHLFPISFVLNISTKPPLIQNPTNNKQHQQKLAAVSVLNVCDSNAFVCSTCRSYMAMLRNHWTHQRMDDFKTKYWTNFSRGLKLLHTFWCHTHIYQYSAFECKYIYFMSIHLPLFCAHSHKQFLMK